MLFKERPDNLTLNADPLAVDNPQGEQSAFQTSGDVLGDNRPCLMWRKLMQVEGSVNMILQRFIILSSIPNHNRTTRNI